METGETPPTLQVPVCDCIRDMIPQMGLYDLEAEIIHQSRKNLTITTCSLRKKTTLPDLMILRGTRLQKAHKTTVNSNLHPRMTKVLAACHQVWLQRLQL
jgi:hypothetical protein